MICTYNTCTNELSGRATKFCSIGCKNNFHVTKTRRSNKKKLVDFFGGQCVRCGYNKNVAALQFHHKDDNKSFGIAKGGHTKAFATLLKEASKCDLICANCHAEEHSPG